MIKLANGIWIGGSGAEASTNVDALEIGGILNVAVDMDTTRGWSTKIEYWHVGLVDGPGNNLSDYCAAILCVKALVRRHKNILVCDHDGGRALAVALMYLNLAEGQLRADPLQWSHWPTWEERHALTCGPLDVDVPRPHGAHIGVFNKIPWGLIQAL